MQYAIELKIIFKAKVFVLIFETINFLTRMCLRGLTRDIMICNFETVSSIRVKHYATIYLWMNWNAPLQGHLHFQALTEVVEQAHPLRMTLFHQRFCFLHILQLLGRFLLHLLHMYINGLLYFSLWYNGQRCTFNFRVLPYRRLMCFLGLDTSSELMCRSHFRTVKAFLHFVLSNEEIESSA